MTAATLLTRDIMTAAEKVRSRAIPLYGVDLSHRPEGFGSAVILRVGDRYFIVTAGHVMHDLKDSAIYVATTGGLIELTDRGYTSVVPAEKAEEYLKDIAVAPISASLVNAMTYTRPIDLSELDVRDTPSRGVAYTFTGCPASKNKPRPKHKVRPERQAYSVIPALAARYEALGLSPTAHFAGNFALDKQTDGSTIFKGPEPKGMSGGGLWRLGSAVELRKETPPRLIGIGIQHRKTQRLLIGIRIGFAIATLKTCYPETAKVLPRLPVSFRVSILPS